MIGRLDIGRYIVIKRSIVSAAAVLLGSAALFAAAPAQAHVSVGIGIGLPGYYAPPPVYYAPPPPVYYAPPPPVYYGPPPPPVYYGGPYWHHRPDWRRGPPPPGWYR